MTIFRSSRTFEPSPHRLERLALLTALHVFGCDNDGRDQGGAGSGRSGSATVTIDGEEVAFPRTNCFTGVEFFAVEALDAQWEGVVLDLQVRFPHDLSPGAEPGDYHWNRGEIRLLPDGRPSLETSWSEDGPITGDRTGASGSGIVIDNRADPDEREATARTVELTITCPT